jgi:hypothetical protein
MVYPIIHRVSTIPLAVFRQVTLSFGASGTKPQSCSRSAASNFPSSARTLLKIS